jgi:mercuric ion binding protein
MKRIILAAAGAFAIAGLAAVAGVAGVAGPGTSAGAAVRAQTAKFAIANMTCATCPIAVKAAMQRVPGVQSVAVSFEEKTATVVFDPSLAKPEAIAAASTGVGFPATLVR